MFFSFFFFFLKNKKIIFRKQTPNRPNISMEVQEHDNNIIKDNGRHGRRKYVIWSNLVKKLEMKEELLEWPPSNQTRATHYSLSQWTPLVTTSQTLAYFCSNNWEEDIHIIPKISL